MMAGRETEIVARRVRTMRIPRSMDLLKFTKQSSELNIYSSRVKPFRSESRSVRTSRGVGGITLPQVEIIYINKSHLSQKTAGVEIAE